MTRRFLPAVLALSVSGCASTGHVPQPFPHPGAGPPPGATEPAAAAPAGTADAYGVTGTALDLRGAPYRNGGTDPGGFDCSGFVWYVFGQHGVRMPRTVTDLVRMGRAVDRRDIEPGDLVFFDTSGSGVSHVGIALGGDEFIHAPSSNGEVRVERLSGAYWAARFVTARRVL